MPTHAQLIADLKGRSAGGKLSKMNKSQLWRSLAEIVTVTSGQASELSTIFNMSNTILGSGTLAMPYACYRCGAAVFVMLLILVRRLVRKIFSRGVIKLGLSAYLGTQVYYDTQR
eukprot:COSAG01_NODE_5450_length_4256_cov_29.355785_3_plen_115_part_00